ncbi:hypothetical protein [Propionivibrio limicola]|uniref:hypothetical protein n=1 Tax=Propionivibrio limicola TaxID=167645 RepID=UPI001291C8B6|nr:hypothetical protein [Propionivibrio limicola]
MKMKHLTFDEASEILDEATYLQPAIKNGEKAIHFGIDREGREFILIISGVLGEGKLGFF